MVRSGQVRLGVKALKRSKRAAVQGSPTKIKQAKAAGLRAAGPGPIKATGALARTSLDGRPSQGCRTPIFPSIRNLYDFRFFRDFLLHCCRFKLPRRGSQVQGRRAFRIIGC